MANILEFLRTVLVDGDAQGDFRRDPPGYLKEGGFGDLTGEDVAEAMNVLRRSLSAPVASGLEPFAAADGEGLPEIRPVGTESELEAAARVLGFALDRCPAPPPASASTGGPAPASAPPPPPSETVAAGSVPSWSGVEDLPPPPPAAEPFVPDAPAAAVAPEVEDTHAQEPHAHEPHAEEPSAEVPHAEERQPYADESHAEAAAGTAEPQADVAARAGSTYGAALDAAVAAARQRHEAALSRYTDESGSTARELGERLDELINDAHVQAGDITSAAEASLSQLREEAAAARQRGEDEARAIIEQAHRDAEEIRAAAHADAEASRRDIEHRRAALRAAEEQLREKLSGIDSLFRQVLHDDEEPEGSRNPEGAGPT